MLTQKEYAQRRHRLMQTMAPNSVALLVAAPEQIRSGDTHFPYRQQSDFYYLTGFSEPEAIAVLINDSEEGRFILFNRKRDPAQEVWTGPRVGQDGARQLYGATQVFAIDELNQVLPEFLSHCKQVYYDFGLARNFDNQLIAWLNELRAKIRSGIATPFAFLSLADILHEMRLIKSEAELSLMRKAIAISIEGHTRAMQQCKPGMMEYQLEAELLYEFNRNGSRVPAYPSIVGGGKNACILHYINNEESLNNGDLVLVDAGAEYQNYCADITRTFPVNGRFTQEQKAIYQLVLQAQYAGIKEVRPGNSWVKIQEAIVDVITNGLVEFGILKGKVAALIEAKAYRSFYMHNSGHWLGLDVHDVGRYKVDEKWRSLMPGMVLTVEPGIYIAAHHDEIDPKWHNIGVRIEDDILVTQQGCEVLSQALPKEISEIEALLTK